MNIKQSLLVLLSFTIHGLVVGAFGVSDIAYMVGALAMAVVLIFNKIDEVAGR